MTSQQRMLMWAMSARARVLVLLLVLLSHSSAIAWHAEESDKAIHTLNDAHDAAVISDPGAVLRDESLLQVNQQTNALALEDDVIAKAESPLVESATMNRAVKATTTATSDEDSKTIQAHTPDPTVTRSRSVGVASGLVLGIGCTAILAVAAAFATGRRGGGEARSGR
ncbi:hypothetical protein PINS_up002814 [Pythium insidiosum]|nr:hypothetical protein PINS_up002814 [Pythium insidiosum]